MTDGTTTGGRIGFVQVITPPDVCAKHGRADMAVMLEQRSNVFWVDGVRVNEGDPLYVCLSCVREGLNEERDAAREIALDLFTQACQIHPNSSDDPIQEPRFDNMALRLYEGAEEALIAWGLVPPEACVRRRPR